MIPINHTLLLYIALCLLFFTMLTNITLLDGEWNGITQFIGTGIFIFATAIYGMSRMKK